MGIRQQSLNELLLRLERDGYAERVPSEEDRRVMIVRLTEKGRQLNQDPFDAEDIFGCLNEEELGSLNAILGKVIANLEEKSADEGQEGCREFIERMRASMSEEDFRRLMRMRGGPRHHRGPFGPQMGMCWKGPEAPMPPMGWPRWKPAGWGQPQWKGPWMGPSECRPPMRGPCGGGFGSPPMPPRRF
jgi:DNA-binding MarR family transcriptional regulator